MVFSYPPDIICCQCAAWHTDTPVSPLSMTVSQQATLPSAEPQCSLTILIAAHDDVARRAHFSFLIFSHHLVSLRIHFLNASAVHTQPVKAIVVFHYSVNIAKGQTGETGHGIVIHRQSVLIGGNPHAAQLVEIQVLGCDVGQRGFITSHVSKLSPFLVLEV